MAHADGVERLVRSYRFGPFELDVKSGDLRKHGTRMRLPEQPFRILLLLLEGGGEVVPREEIRQKLWPNDTIVEYDPNINAAVKKLRDVLGESAEKPRYIETLARRGYRFLAEIEQVREETEAPRPPADPSFDPTAGLGGGSFSHYRVLDKLGSGGMGVVFRAHDLTLNRQIALKFLSSEYRKHAPSLERFQREARAAAALNHPNICTVYEIGEYRSQPYIAMELLEGETFKDRLLRGPLDKGEVLRLTIQIADGLAAAHRLGFIHRDLKPANLYLTARGNAKILDFGLAKLCRDVEAVTQCSPGESEGGPAREINMTVEGLRIGTVAYMSPEQARGEQLDQRSDLFSLGVVMYEMLSGRQAFSGISSAELVSAILKDEPAELPGTVPPDLAAIVKRCMEKDPGRRFQTAAELALALQPSFVPLAAPPRRFSSKWMGLAAGLIAAAAAVIWLDSPPTSTTRHRNPSDYRRREAKWRTHAYRWLAAILQSGVDWRIRQRAALADAAEWRRASAVACVAAWCFLGRGSFTRPNGVSCTPLHRLHSRAVLR